MKQNILDISKLTVTLIYKGNYNVILLLLLLLVLSPAYYLLATNTEKFT